LVGQLLSFSKNYSQPIYKCETQSTRQLILFNFELFH